MKYTFYMKTQNTDLPIVITSRHQEVTNEMKVYGREKIEGLHLDYPKIIEAKLILDISNYRQMAEIILFCANHIVIEADTTTDDMHASIDDTISKIARRMRKYKTRLQKMHRSRRNTIRKVNEVVYENEILDKNEIIDQEDHHDDLAIDPLVINEDHYSVKPLFPEEAVLDLELSEKPFVVFHNEKTDKVAVLYRRKDGHLGLIEP